jgi:hypothetical protein
MKISVFYINCKTPESIILEDQQKVKNRKMTIMVYDLKKIIQTNQVITWQMWPGKI